MRTSCNRGRVDWKDDLRGREALKAERPMIEDISSMRWENWNAIDVVLLDGGTMQLTFRA